MKRSVWKYAACALAALLLAIPCAALAAGVTDPGMPGAASSVMDTTGGLPGTGTAGGTTDGGAGTAGKYPGRTDTGDGGNLGDTSAAGGSAGDGAIDRAREGVESAMTSSGMEEDTGWGWFGVILTVVILVAAVVLVVALVPRRKNMM